MVKYELLTTFSSGIANCRYKATERSSSITSKDIHLNQVPLELGAVVVPSEIKNCPDAASNSIRACCNEIVSSTHTTFSPLHKHSATVLLRPRPSTAPSWSIMYD
jgi:hypothetical protein